MLLTISTTHRPATDLGYLLHKNPGRFQSFDLAFGRADVFYPVADDERCTAALMLDIDPIALARRARGGRSSNAPLQHYVNDRPYVASSHLSVAISSVYSSALAGNSRERPELAETPIPLEAGIEVAPSDSGAELIHRLFEPLGYSVQTREHPLDERFPDWGPSRYFSIALSGTTRLRDLLKHLYVLMPVLDDHKHYWVGDDEVSKLLRFGDGWLDVHPERDLISRRYLRHSRGLINDALSQLLHEGQAAAPSPDGRRQQGEAQLEAPLRLADQRIGAVLSTLGEIGAVRILDLGCGEGRLIRELLKSPHIASVTGLDVSHAALETARRRLDIEGMSNQQRQRVTLIHGSLTYRDSRLAGHDAAIAMEVIEHIDPSRLDAFEEVLFGEARPGTVIVTTPNAEYNVLFTTLPAERYRHSDHRFEWTRQEFQAWSRGVSERRGYEVRFQDIGPVDPKLGAPTQMGVFTR